MADFKIGQIVSRKSYGSDILFKITGISNPGKEPVYSLKGICYRIEADAPQSDLVTHGEQSVREYVTRSDFAADAKFRSMTRSSQLVRGGGGAGMGGSTGGSGSGGSGGGSIKDYFRKTSNDKAKTFSKPGKVLHLDGDGDYMEKCLQKYREAGVEAVGQMVPEKNQPMAVKELLEKNKPDILVLTGHDGMLKNSSDINSLDNYRNSRYFINAVIEARKYDKDIDNLVIFAGACQSLYPMILAAGANFCSAPNRILIHALDPVMVGEKIALTRVDTVLTPLEVVNSTMSGYKGIGGIQTRGKARDVYPMDDPKIN